MILPYAYGRPACQATIRSLAEDFQVDEVLGFTPDGDGEHQLLQIRKRNTNTEWLARQLARWAGVKPLDVSYAGLKDRRAVTSQWFTVRLAGKPAPDWQQYANGDIEFLQIATHRRKLKLGALKSNRFRLVMRQLEGDLAKLVARLEMIDQHGVPNYFGEQRFGHNNLAEAAALFAGTSTVRNRHQQKMFLSAARSFLFNQVLAHRVNSNLWNQALPGDVMMLNGTHSIFKVAEIDAEILRRIQQQDIHPTGPLWGAGLLPTQMQALTFEQTILEEYPMWCTGLAGYDMKQERRALRLIPQNFSYQIDEKAATLVLAFDLVAGCYATAVLREICDYTTGEWLSEIDNATLP